MKKINKKSLFFIFFNIFITLCIIGCNQCKKQEEYQPETLNNFSPEKNEYNKELTAKIEQLINCYNGNTKPNAKKRLPTLHRKASSKL